MKNDADEYNLLHRHFKKLMDHRFFGQSDIVFVPENNLGLEAAHMDTMVKDLPGVRTFWEKKDRPGVCKNGKNSRDYQFYLNNLLMENGLLFGDDTFTCSRDRTVENIKLLLEEQMRRYHWERQKAKDNFGKDRIAITGKVGSKQDDLIISVMMVAYWGRIIKNQRQ